MMRALLGAMTLLPLLVGCGASGGQGGGTDPVSGGPDPSIPDPSNPPAASGPCSGTSGYAGDDLCIAPPDPSEGIQLHVGPSNYDDPDEIARYVIGAGEENVRCFNAIVPDGDFYYMKQQNRMRSGSHHMLINLGSADGIVEGPAATCETIGSMGSIPGSQTPKRDFPDKLAPEDEGLARYMPPNAAAEFQLHYVNTGSEPMLREAWVNLYKKDPAEVTERLQTIFLVGDILLNIPPKTRQTTDLAFTPKLTGTTRIFQMVGHMHAHTESFTVWRTRGTDREMIYQTFDWAEPSTLTFNTVTDNAAPNPEAHTEGGATGLFYLEPGDKLEWACDVNNTLDTALHFANEAYTAEMCLLSGAYVSDSSGLLAGACARGSCTGR